MLEAQAFKVLDEPGVVGMIMRNKQVVDIRYCETFPLQGREQLGQRSRPTHVDKHSLQVALHDVIVGRVVAYVDDIDHLERPQGVSRICFMLAPDIIKPLNNFKQMYLKVRPVSLSARRRRVSLGHARKMTAAPSAAVAGTKRSPAGVVMTGSSCSSSQAWVAFRSRTATA